jgi:hypothetical protein
MKGLNMGDGKCGIVHYSHLGKILLFICFTLFCSVCGYRVRSAAANLPDGLESLGIPTFTNLTREYKIEQLLTAAVLEEFRMRTRAPINSSKSGVDAVLLGEIRSVGSVPVIFGTQKTGGQTYASAYQITVHVSVQLMRLRDSAILWQNRDFIHQERYVLNTEVQDFFDEENPALKRLARDFSASLASDILDRSKP